MIRHNNKYYRSFGFTMIEMLIGIIILSSLSATAISIYYHYFHLQSTALKISDSIKQIKQAATIYYFNHKQAAQNLNINTLVSDHYLDPTSIYQGAKELNGATVSHDFNYNVSFNDNTKTITVSLDTYQSIRLNRSNPVKMTQIKHGHNHPLFTYQWTFTPILPAGQEASVSQAEYINRITTGEVR